MESHKEALYILEIEIWRDWIPPWQLCELFDLWHIEDKSEKFFIGFLEKKKFSLKAELHFYLTKKF